MIRTPDELFARAAVCKELLDSKFNGSDGKIYLMICGGGGCVASGALKLEEECKKTCFCCKNRHFFKKYRKKYKKVFTNGKICVILLTRNPRGFRNLLFISL